MVDRADQPTERGHSGWRVFIVALLASLGLLAWLGFSIVHWTERQILTTDNWVKVVAPLPQNDTVASALSSYAVDSFFEGFNIEQKISQVLPPRANFLAPMLTSQLQSRITKRTKQIIQSNQFLSLWTSANRIAHQKLIDAARRPPQSSSTQTSFSLHLDSLKASIESVLGKQNVSFLTSNDGQAEAHSQNIGLVSTVKTKISTLHSYIRTVDFLNGTLWLLAIACLGGALTLSYHRRKLLVIIGGTILVIGLVQLISVKVARPTVLNHVHNAAYRPAVAVVYDDLLASFRTTALASVIIGAIIALGSLLSNQKLVNKYKPVVRLLDDLRASKLWSLVRRAREFVGRYKWYFMVGAALVTLVLLAFVFNPNGLGLIRALLILVLVIELIILVIPRARRSPM